MALICVLDSCDLLLESKFKNSSINNFWLSVAEKYPEHSYEA
jgi:hypothetical protein